MSDKFKPGDVVQLQSGGPAMTVDKKHDHGKEESYWCDWFKGASKERSVFSAASLKIYTPPQNSK